jgi:hypothetical protein
MEIVKENIFIMRKLFFLFTFLIPSTILSAETDDVISKLSNIDLPVIYIETTNGEMPTYDIADHPLGWGGRTIKNQTKVPGRIRITQKNQLLYDSGNYEEGNSGMTIRVRGNTSAWKHDKKPYKIKLQKKSDLLMRGDDNVFADKDWLLLKDENLRKSFTFKVNELMNLQWTPAYEYVNVVFNGTYYGIYMLVESVKRNTTCRLNVEKTGYIFEYDIYWWNEDVYVESPTPLPGVMNYTFKYPDPEKITNEQLSYFENMIYSMERSLANGTYHEYIDVNSFASWILGHDILGNIDGKGSNFYITKKDDTTNSKLMMGPLWDCEHMFEANETWDASRDVFVFPSLFDNNNQTFLKAYKNRWEEVSSTLFDDFVAYLENFATSDIAKAIDESMPLNNERWSKDYGSVRQYVDEAESWMIERMVWLEKKISKIKTSINTIQKDSHVNKNAALYNIYGIEVLHPLRPGVYIYNGKKVVKK